MRFLLSQWISGLTPWQLDSRRKRCLPYARSHDPIKLWATSLRQTMVGNSATTLACEFQRTEWRRHDSEHETTRGKKIAGPSLRGYEPLFRGRPTGLSALKDPCSCCSPRIHSEPFPLPKSFGRLAWDTSENVNDGSRHSAKYWCYAKS
jgi:hypothetical protein